MSDYNFGPVMECFVGLLVVTGILSLFGIWKLIEIGIWLYQHLHITIK